VFVVATVLELADRLNLFFQPPNLPASANLVDRVLGSIAYRHDIWPVFFTENLLIGVGFMALSILGVALAAQVAAADQRRPLLGGALVTAGVLGAAGQLVLVGSVKASIDIPYCDCGFKEQEIVSQVWALMVTQGASEWLVNGAVLLAALGIAVAGIVFAGRLGSGWRTFSWVIAALVVAALLVGLIGRSDDLETALTFLLTGIVVPAWAIWLGLRLPELAAAKV
jgi:hypothetical protein